MLREQVIYSYFDASYAFTAAITLYLTKNLRSTTSNGSNQLTFTDEDQFLLETTIRILKNQSEVGNVPAREFTRLLHTLESNFCALQTVLQGSAYVQDIDTHYSDLDLSSFIAGGNLSLGLGP